MKIHQKIDKFISKMPKKNSHIKGAQAQGPPNMPLRRGTDMWEWGGPYPIADDTM